MMAVAEREKNPELGKQVFAWVKKALAAAPQPVLDARVGDSLKALGMEKEALDYWKSGLALNREDRYVYECAARRAAADHRRRTAGVGPAAGRPAQPLLRPVRLVARRRPPGRPRPEQLREGAPRPDRIRTAARGTRVRRLTRQVVYSWLELCRSDKTLPEADRRRILARRPRPGRRQLLPRSPTCCCWTRAKRRSMAPLQRLLAYQAATRMLSNDGSEWERMVPLAQALMEKKQYAAGRRAADRPAGQRDRTWTRRGATTPAP